MEWMKASVETTSEGVELVFGVLFSCGINGVQIIDANDLKNSLASDALQWDYVDEALFSTQSSAALVEFYTTPDLAGMEVLNQIKTQLEQLKNADVFLPLGSLSLSSELLDDSTWLNEWKKNYKPFRIGQRIVVAPIWEEYAKLPGDIVFTIDPGSVFGTGLHQSTQLCIEALEKYLSPGDSMLDLGCGSGILSIIGLHLGADSVIACDFDPAAAVATNANIVHNAIDPKKIKTLTGDIFTDAVIKDEVENNLFNIITVNIVADAVISVNPFVKPRLAPGGYLISSGIINERADDVIESFIKNGYTIVEELSRDGWHGFVCRV